MTNEDIITALAAVAGLSASMGSGQVSAHVVFNVNKVVAKDGGHAALRLGHGYAGNPTTSVSARAGGHR